MDNNKKVIIWLEDKPDLNEEFKTRFANSNFDLVACKDLRQFEQAVQSWAEKKNDVAGFVLDVLIPSEDLRVLGMQTVKTDGSNQTGIAVLRSYLRNADGDSPAKNTWKEHKILILTALDETYLKNRNAAYIKWEKEHGDNTVWLSKVDDQGDRRKTIEEIEKWLRSL